MTGPIPGYNVTDMEATTKTTHPCESCGFALPAGQRRCRSQAACTRRAVARAAQTPTEGLCVVCLHERDDEGKLYIQGYGRDADGPRSDWPMTELAGHPVHKACQSDLQWALGFAEKSEWRDGAYRWHSNGSAAPSDCVRMAVRLGLADAGRLAQHDATRSAEDAKAIETYRRNWRPPTGEALAEMRAEFGEGAEVVDVIAGRRFRV